MLRPLLEGALDLLAPPRCAACDATLDAGAAGFCDACAPLLDPDPTGLGALIYGGPVADAVRRFKYGPRPELARPLGARLAQAALAHAGQVDAVVPVPLHPRRLAARGFNQASLLARPVARALGVPLSFALRRLRHTPSQASLEVTRRLDNVRGAFRARPAGGRVLLIDDVRTTGATLAECASALAAAGAREVRPLVLARAEG